MFDNSANYKSERPRILPNHLFTIMPIEGISTAELLCNTNKTRAIFDVCVKLKMPLETILEAIIIHHERGDFSIKNLIRK